MISLAPPTIVYLILLVLGTGGTAAAAGGIGAAISGLVVGGLWAYLIETVYRAQWRKTAWTLALLPVIIGILALLLILKLVSGLH